MHPVHKSCQESIPRHFSQRPCCKVPCANISAEDPLKRSCTDPLKDSACESCQETLSRHHAHRSRQEILEDLYDSTGSLLQGCRQGVLTCNLGKPCAKQDQDICLRSLRDLCVRSLAGQDLYTGAPSSSREHPLQDLSGPAQGLIFAEDPPEKGDLCWEDL